MREFDTGATRDSDDEKMDYEGFFSPLVLQRRAAYMHKHRLQKDGKMRDSDNWTRGMPIAVYVKSAFRHFVDWWRAHRYGDDEAAEESICALMFNCEGALYELLKKKKEAPYGPGRSGGCCS